MRLLMKLIPAEQCARECFAEGHRPDPRTVRSWVRKKLIPGLELGGRVYVDAEGLEAQLSATATPQIRTVRPSAYRI